MKASGKVVEVNGDMIKVVTVRSAACDSCEKCAQKGACSAHLVLGEENKTVETDVFNAVGAKVGDTVELASSGERILLVSLVVFVFPVLLSMIGYFIADKLTDNIYAPAVSLGAVFVISFAAAAFFMNKYAQKNIRIEAVKIIEENA